MALDSLALAPGLRRSAPSCSSATSGASTARPPTTGSGPIVSRAAGAAGTRSASTSAPSRAARCSSTARTAASSAPPSTPTRTASSTSACPAPDEDVDARGGLGAPGSRRLRRRLPRGGAGAARRDGRRPGRGDRRRDRLHLVHDAPDHGRRDAALPARRTCGAIRTPGSSSGSTTRRSRRPTGSTRSRPSAASRGSRATAGRSPRSGSSPSRCRSCARRPRSTRAPSG